MPMPFVRCPSGTAVGALCRWGGVFMAMLFVVGGGAPAHAQSVGSGGVDGQPQGLAWDLVADGRSVAWTARRLPLDSLRVVAREALAFLQADGFYLAHIDSVRVDTSRMPPRATLFAVRGPAVEVGTVHLAGAEVLDSLALLRLMDTRPGRTLDPARLEADLEAILLRYEDAGYPLASIRLDDIRLEPGEPPGLEVFLTIDEGRTLRLARVELPGAGRTTALYVARIAGLRPGRSLTNYDPGAIQQRLEATTFFRDVGLPELLVEDDSSAVVRIPLDEEAPGAFDLVVGYLPSSGSGGGGGLIGNGHLILRNLFGAGRRLSLKLNRLPGSVSSVDVRAADPFLLGLPLSAEGRFEGLQQDSTFDKQRYGLEVGYRFVGALELFGTLSQEETKPGPSGARLNFQGRQRVARASALFAGLGVRVQRVDRRINPRRGFFLETNFERGRKERTERRRRVAEQDTVVERTLLRQQRLRGEGRVFLPVLPRQVAVFGGEAHVLLSDEYDASDLFRFGGATSLRGYDEERFLSSLASRVFVEYRYLLDRTSYAFLFFDLGYVERGETIGLDGSVDLEPFSGFFPGYGFGFQVGTDLGLINLSLAANPDEPTEVRAHLGLSFGL